MTYGDEADAVWTEEVNGRLILMLEIDEEIDPLSLDACFEAETGRPGYERPPGWWPPEAV